MAREGRVTDTVYAHTYLHTQAHVRTRQRSALSMHTVCMGVCVCVRVCVCRSTFAGDRGEEGRVGWVRRTRKHKLLPDQQAMHITIVIKGWRTGPAPAPNDRHGRVSHWYARATGWVAHATHAIKAWHRPRRTSSLPLARPIASCKHRHTQVDFSHSLSL
jgi:hypothetical protein